MPIGSADQSFRQWKLSTFTCAALHPTASPDTFSWSSTQLLLKWKQVDGDHSTLHPFIIKLLFTHLEPVSSLSLKLSILSEIFFPKIKVWQALPNIIVNCLWDAEINTNLSFLSWEHITLHLPRSKKKRS